MTLDKDFGEHPIVYGEPHCGIVRLVGIPARKQTELDLWNIKTTLGMEHPRCKTPEMAFKAKLNAEDGQQDKQDREVVF